MHIDMHMAGPPMEFDHHYPVNYVSSEGVKYVEQIQTQQTKHWVIKVNKMILTEIN